LVTVGRYTVHRGFRGGPGRQSGEHAEPSAVRSGFGHRGIGAGREASAIGHAQPKQSAVVRRGLDIDVRQGIKVNREFSSWAVPCLGIPEVILAKRGVRTISMAHATETALIMRLLFGCLLLGSCALATPKPDTARLPFAAFGTLDNDVAAANQASWAFAAPARTRNDPVDAARACAAIDYLAGELSSNPRWLSVSPLTKQQMLQARIDVRRVLGIDPGVPSQIVVNALMIFAAAWQAGDQPVALQALAAPGFTLPPPHLVQVLAELPYVQSANVASTETAQQMLPGGDNPRGW
jgi:hypothetical protein